MGRNDRLAEMLEERIVKEGKFTFREIKWWNKSPLVFLSEGSTKLVMKFPQKGRARKECEKAYKVMRTVEDNTNLVRIIGDKPFQYGECYGVLMEEADTNLDEYLSDFDNFGNRVSIEEEAKKIILDLSLGLEQLHKKNIRHRDIKLTNALLYGDTWALSDFGASKDSDFTQSHESPLSYASYEEVRDIGESIREISFPQDRFSMGVILYQLLNPNKKTLYKERAGGYNYKFAVQQIEKLKVSDFTKHVLKNFVGEIAPKDTPKNKLGNYRYRSISIPIEELRTGKKVNESYDDIDYDKFLELNEDVLGLIEIADSDRNYTAFGNVKMSSIDEVVTVYNKLEKLSNKKEVRLGPETKELMVETKDKFDALYDKDYELLEKFGKSKKAKDVTDKEYRQLSEISFLWGPPDFTYKSRQGLGGKLRYTYEETMNCDTHYHKENGWTK